MIYSGYAECVPKGLATAGGALYIALRWRRSPQAYKSFHPKLPTLQSL
jgi:hypothetical protein